MPTPRLILAGGGDAPDSQPLDALFAGWIGPGGRMLYLPVATGNAAGYRDDLAGVSAIFRPLGVGSIAMWTNLAGRDAGQLTDFDGIYIGGGNTFHLLDLLRRTGFAALLRDFIAAGGAVYGGSAGAIILGRDIGPAAHIDPNTTGVTDTRGLDLLGGYAVWCHYDADADVPRIRAYVAATGFPVLALTERAGLRVEGPRILAAGYDPCVLYTSEGQHIIPVGAPVTARAYHGLEFDGFRIMAPLMAGLLQFVADQQEHSNAGALQYLSSLFAVPQKYLNECTPGGTRRIFDAKVETARNILKKHGLIEATRRGHFRITTQGVDFIQNKPAPPPSPILREVRISLRTFKITGPSLYLFPVYVSYH